MNILKYLAYILIFYLIFKFIGRLLNPPQKETQKKAPKPRIKEEEPKFNIEAETVDYEIIDSKNQQND